MRNLLLITVIFLLFSSSSKAQYVNIPDPNFKTWMMTWYPDCFNASQMLDTTCAAIVNEGTFQPFGLYGVTNWDGFQYFKNLQVVDMSSGSYTSLPPVWPTTLKKLNLRGLPQTVTSLPNNLPNGLLWLEFQNSAQITTWPVLPNSLQHLDCMGCYYLPPPAAFPTSLKYFNSTDNYFTSLPALPATLDTLICEMNQLSSLPALPATLKMLICDGNYLTSLPALPSGLKYLDCSNNNIPVLPALPNSLERMRIISLGLTSLPTIPTSLITLLAYGNHIPSLPALPASLIELSVGGSDITVLPALPAGLLTLGVSNNELTSLPALPASLTQLSCGSNHLTSLPALHEGLTDLDCGYNQITNIPSFPSTLTGISCSGNPMISLPPLPPHLVRLNVANSPIYFLPELPNHTMTYMDITDCPNLTCLPVLPEAGPGTLDIYMTNIINCVPNSPNTVWLTVYDTTAGSGIPFGGTGAAYGLCSAINNMHQCDAFPLMEGYAYYDNNNNNIKDANEPYRANVKVQLSNGAYTITNSDGYYQISADNIGNYTLSVTPPDFFTSAPMQYNFNFSNFDTLVTNNFAFHAATTRDSLAINIIPVSSAARPGFPYPYQIAYENDGTTTLNANVVFNYDNTRLIYDSSSNAAVINTGSSLTLPEPGFVPGIQKSFIGYFHVNPSAVIGDSLRAGAHIYGGSAAAHDSDVVVIRGSYDPNDKSATPKLTTTQLANGDDIYYTIRFQNTGTDTAFNIVVTDTLDNKLQPSTLHMIATSHPCITTVKGNTVSYEFINILLPDSNVNQLKSHGYISFRIKPLNTLVVNDNVPNKAAIYFDYNSPVITNSAITTIVDPVVLPLKLVSFTVSRGVGLNANVYWQTNDEVSVKDYTIEMSTNVRTFTAVGVENAKGYQYNSYTKPVTIPAAAILYFRLKMTDIDGWVSYSNTAILRNDKVNDAFSFLNNPVKNELSISLLDESLRNTTATIFTSQGVKVKTILLQQDVENINVRPLPAGTYYLVTEKGSRQFVVLK